MAGQKQKIKKTVKKNIPIGKCFIQSTFNNTIITFTDLEGNVISWGTAGAKGFKGSKKSTPFAAQQACEDASKKAQLCGMKKVSVYVKGPGGGRESAIRTISANNIKISSIKDTTPIPHNGCRPPKRRRV